MAATLRDLIPVAAATLFVAVLPVALVWWLRASGTVTSPVLGVGLGMGLSCGASYVGRAYWESRPGSEDRLFSELMIWGHLHRWRTERRLHSAREVLGAMNRAQRRLDGGLSAERQSKLLQQLAVGMDARDASTHGHSRRVARHAWMIARRMGLSREEVARIRTAAAIHDIGKIETPTAILRKDGALTDAEYDVIKRHPDDGARMAEVLQDVNLTSIIRYHHERSDGSGYPDALAGEEIPLGARIVAVADTFDAITSARPYRAACPHKRALDILKSEAGTKLDADVVRAFCGHYSGRRPLAIWALLASLPERVASSLGGSITGVAAAAKVMAVAAVVGSAAASTATLAKPAPPAAHRTATDVASQQVARVTASSVQGGSLTQSSARLGHVNRTVAHSPGARSGKITATPGSAVAGSTPAASNTVLAPPQAAAQTPSASAPAAGALATNGQGSGVTGVPTSPKSPGTPEAAGKANGGEETPTKPKTPAPAPKPVKSGGPEKHERPSPPTKPEKPAPPGKSEKPVPPAKPEKPAPPGKSEKPAAAPETPAPSAHPEKPEKPPKPEPPAKAEKPEAPAKPEKAHGPEKSEGKNES